MMVFRSVTALCAATVITGQVFPPTQQMYADANTIISFINTNAGNRTAWDRLAFTTDTFGPRFTGTQALTDAIAWFGQMAAADGLLVKMDPVEGLPRWVRGNEWAVLEAPRKKDLHFCG